MLHVTVLNDQLISKLPKWLLIMSPSVLYFLYFQTYFIYVCYIYRRVLINGLDLPFIDACSTNFVQVNKRQTQTHIGYKIFVKLHSDLYIPFFYEIFYKNELQKRLNENFNKIWREINNMMDYKFKKILGSL